LDAAALERTAAGRVPGFYRNFDLYRFIRIVYPDFSTAVVETSILEIQMSKSKLPACRQAGKTNTNSQIPILDFEV